MQGFYRSIVFGVVLFYMSVALGIVAFAAMFRRSIGSHPSERQAIAFSAGGGLANQRE